MPTVRRYPSPILAQHAAAYLRRHGIIATTVGHLSAFPGLQGPGLSLSARDATGAGQFSVVIDSAADHPEATRLLDEFDRSPPEPDEGWELDALPDLSLLDPALSPPCPSCHRPLPMDAAVERCPACGAEADVPALLAARHGPELLARCIAPPQRDPIPDEILDAANLRCPACAYPLQGLPCDGPCPECGEWYSKQTMLEMP